jgi:hypothetical protein
MLKIAIGFVMGAVACGLILFGARTVLPAHAVDGDDPAVSENVSTGLLDLLPDIDRIYRQSLTMPFVQAESKITDPDIAAYYRSLMDATGLDDPNY